VSGAITARRGKWRRYRRESRVNSVNPAMAA